MSVEPDLQFMGHRQQVKLRRRDTARFTVDIDFRSRRFAHHFDHTVQPDQRYLKPPAAVRSHRKFPGHGFVAGFGHCDGVRAARTQPQGQWRRPLELTVHADGCARRIGHQLHTAVGLHHGDLGQVEGLIGEHRDRLPPRIMSGKP